ncbi:MAG: HPF/RaiA family ribosome-associated protein, partial [Candidatus Latescibacteria bacterium]|jgi:ribosomal subunit interface protein|nr:HPF/RaiA family ribosome-associated protein [Candidatus Latescibacterota bacterium]
MRTTVERLAERLPRYHDRVSDLNITVTKEGPNHDAHATVKVVDRTLAAREKAIEAKEALKGVMDKLIRQVKDYNAKLKGHK